jgi:hypothetical protein
VLTRKSFATLKICIISLLLFSCNKENAWDCIQTTGDIVSETREVNGFCYIRLEDNINLIITQDSIESVRLE